MHGTFPVVPDVTEEGSCGSGPGGRGYWHQLTRYLDSGGDRKLAEDTLLALSSGKVILHPGSSRHQRAWAREAMVDEEVGTMGSSGPGGSDPSWSWPGAAAKAQCP